MHHPIKTCKTNGFALVAALSILALITLLAVSMFTLSRVAMQSASLSGGQTEAKANARMALMMAIGELQAELGPDQRISANASILDSDANTTEVDDISQPNWMGVWGSWKAGGSSASGHSTIQGVNDTEMHPSYEEGREPYFRSWLVSVDENDAAKLEQLTTPTSNSLISNPSTSPNSTHDAVTLVGAGSLGDDNTSGTEHVHVPLVEMTDGAGSTQGRYGWWVGDESQKARIMPDEYNASTTLTIADKIYRQSAPGTVGTNLLSGLENVDQSNFDRVINLSSLDLLEGISEGINPSEVNFHHITTMSLGVLSDVREGGLKRDLSTLLEQPVDIDDQVTTDKYMLYEFDDPRFDDRKHSRVPIQDLSAYYQLYKNDAALTNEPHQGVEFADNSIGVVAPDFGSDSSNSTDKEKFVGEYTTLYRNPVPIRVQFVVGVYAKEITPFERNNEYFYSGSKKGVNVREIPIPAHLTHKLMVTITPVATLWNPNNVSMTLTRGEAYTQVLKMGSPACYMEWTKYRAQQGDVITPYPTNLASMAIGTGGDAISYQDLATMAFSNDDEVVFEPGEVKIFSIPVDGTSLIDRDFYETYADGNANAHSAEPGWDPYGAMPLRHSAWPRSANYLSFDRGQDVYNFASDATKDTVSYLLAFGAGDSITFGLYPENEKGTDKNYKGQNVSASSTVVGSAFNFFLINRGYSKWKSAGGGANLMNYFFTARGAGYNGDGTSHGSNANLTYGSEKNVPFNQDLMRLGFRNGESIEPESQSDSISGADIIAATAADETITLFQFTMTAVSEVNGENISLANAGRSRPARPFLHGSSMAPPFVDRLDPSSLYTYGWEWQLEKINSIDEAPIQQDDENSYYGGGYNAEVGNTHVVQREIPTVPPISIAALSHAHLGGFSLGDEAPVEFNNSTGKGQKNYMGDITRSQGFQRVTAHGFAGLAPHTLQAIGNSYAHPKVASDQASTTWDRYFDYDEDAPKNMTHIDGPQPDSWGGEYDVPCVDHAYLANKALWDEYFFSSIAPQPQSIPLFGGSDKKAADVAEDFFLNGEPLPNRRFVPYTSNTTDDSIRELFAESGDALREDGPIESAAAHMLIRGSFNINSTSEEAWKAFLSSHRGKSIQYYEGGSSLPSELDSSETPIGYGGMANLDTLAATEDTNDARNEEQWRTWRSISDIEIQQLARAIVHQVKLRGPFLSLSEFINRRLESHDDTTELSLKGALQAALDFEGVGDIPEVTINKEFRTPARSLDSEITSEIENDPNTKYPEAFYGPVAYGSAPYVDQADLLRSFAGQLTPRGDTFVIRAYGDKLDSQGEVVARAWCEAVVQRTPEYVAPDDNDHAAHDELTSEANKNFGRRFSIVSFRWLDKNEV